MGKIKLFLKAIKSLVQKRRIASLWKSSLLLKKAIEEAEEKNKQDGRRYFVIWDPAQQKLISITYDYYKDRWDSYKYLFHRGRFRMRMNRGQLKEMCFYYTKSKNGSPSCQDEERKEKMIEWQNYYHRLLVSDRIRVISRCWNLKSLWKKITLRSNKIAHRY